MNNESIGRHAAQQCRADWGLADAPINNLPKLIEDHTDVGVALITSKAPGHGMTMQLSQHTIMAAAVTKNPMRLRSTLAHELGHLRIGSVKRRLDDGDWTKRNAEEIQADAFARHFLLPLDAVRAPQHHTNSDHLLSDLVQMYGVSPAIAAIQMRDTHLIDSPTYEELTQRSTKSVAAQYGWLPEYQALAAGSATPRAPQSLMARATEAYRWRQLSYAALARLQSESDAPQFARELSEQGIEPVSSNDFPVRPLPDKEGLTTDELHFLMNG